jgi:hypothetical protein
MAPVVPTTEPKILTAGDTWAWTKALSNFQPADGWALGYAIRGASVLADSKVACTASGSGFAVKVQGADTKTLKSGTYSWQAYVDNSGTDEHYTVESGVLTILTALTNVTDNSAQSHDERTLAIIEARIENRITTDQESYAINGRSIMHIPIKDLMRLRAAYQARVWRHQNPGKMWVTARAVARNSGGGAGDASPIVLPEWYSGARS